MTSSTQQRRRLLFIQHVPLVGGASWSMFQIIAAIRSDFDVTVALAKPGPLVGALEGIGVKVFVEKRLRCFSDAFLAGRGVLSVRNLWGLLGWRGTVRAAEQICLRETPDIVHINTYLLCHAAIGCRRARVGRVVLHVREPLHFKRGSWLEGLVRRTIDAYVDRVLAISKANAAEVGLPHKTVVVPNWPDFTGREGTLDLEREFGLAKERKVVLVMGGRHPHKGSLTAIRAMAKVSDPSAVLVVLGGRPAGGRLKNGVRMALDRLGVETYGLEMDHLAAASGGRVLLTDQSLNVRSWLERAAFVVCPFTVSHFAKAVVEAGALGKPSIVSAGAPLDEAVVPGETGLVVPVGDADALARALDRLLADAGLTARMGAAARELVATRYSQESSLRLIREAYDGGVA